MVCERKCFNIPNCDIWPNKSSAAGACMCDISLRPAATKATGLPALPHHLKKQVVYFLRTSGALGLFSRGNEGECCLTPQLGTQVNLVWSFPPLHKPGQHRSSRTSSLGTSTLVLGPVPRVQAKTRLNKGFVNTHTCTLEFLWVGLTEP